VSRLSSVDTTTDDQPVAPEPDQALDDLVARFTAALGDAVVAVAPSPGRNVVVRVTLEAWEQAAHVARDIGLTYFCFLSAIDWLPSPYGKSEDDGPPAAPTSAEGLDHGLGGGDTRFQLLARLMSPVTHVGLTLKADLDTAAPVAPTWSRLYPGADWNEREIHEMFGIDFAGHPGLTHIYLPGGFEGHPLRKDFPLISRMVKPWPGMVDVEGMPGEPDEDEEAAEGEGGDE
jgi:NADH-quinone oxidoreductase subunit C